MPASPSYSKYERTQPLDTDGRRVGANSGGVGANSGGVGADASTLLRYLASLTWANATADPLFAETGTMAA